MITIIKGGTGSGKSVRLAKIASEQALSNKKVLIITLFSRELVGLLANDNIIIALSSDDNLQELIADADIVMIDESYHVFKHEHVNLDNLVELGKDIYYTTHQILPDMKYDNIIEVNWKASNVKMYNKSQKVFPDCNSNDKINICLFKMITGNYHMFVDEFDLSIKDSLLLEFDKIINTGNMSLKHIDTSAKFELTVVKELTLIPISSVEFIKKYSIFKNRLVY